MFEKSISVVGAAENNLENITVQFPLGVFTCVTGVSGSGKSTLVVDILYRALAQRLYRSTDRAGRHKDIKGLEHIDKGGTCEACEGDGLIKIAMHFLPDVYVTCDVCRGSRYNRETLDIKFTGKSIADVLSMTVEQAYEF